MTKLWEVVTLTFLGSFAMGNIDTLTSGTKDVGSYGVTTGTIGELVFFLAVFMVIATIWKMYLSN